MQARPLKDDGCTVVDAPYKEEDLDASKLGVDTSFPVLRSPWLKVASDFVKAPVYSTFITPNSPWLVPIMFGPNISGQHNVPNGNRSGDALYVDVRGSFGYVSQASQTGNAGDGGVGCRIDINASRSSAVFGASATVQPSSMYQLACIKI